MLLYNFFHKLSAQTKQIYEAGASVRWELEKLERTRLGGALQASLENKNKQKYTSF